MSEFFYQPGYIKHQEEMEQRENGRELIAITIIFCAIFALFLLTQ